VRRVTIAQLSGWTATLAAAAASLAWALLLVLGGHDARGALVALAGFCLGVWAAFHLTDGPRPR
jgi:hypothetical protein